MLAGCCPCRRRSPWRRGTGSVPRAVAAEHGLRPTDSVDGVSASYGEMLDLPLLYIHGRADSTVSYMGANLYPEDIAAGLEDAQVADIRLSLGSFCLELAGDVEAVPHVHVELVAGG